MSRRMNQILDHLEKRRSAATADLAAPGPDRDELARLLTIASRVPDHGTLAPWRFIVIEGEHRQELSRQMTASLADLGASMPAQERQTAEQKIRKVFTIAPTVVVVVSRTVEGTGIPEIEQVLSAGAACMNLVIAATASGYGANWITGWAAYHPVAHAALGIAAGETIAGIILIGRAGTTQPDRPRPALDTPRQLLDHARRRLTATVSKGLSMSDTMQHATVDRVLDLVDHSLDASLQRLFAFLRIPSISTDPAYAAHCVTAANWLVSDLMSMGFKAEAMPTAGHPVVVGRYDAPADGGKAQNGMTPETLLFYGHYDVQPVDPLDLWTADPFDPRMMKLDDGREVISARGACDDKGQLMTFVEACRAWLQVEGHLPANLRFCIEGEEECGSANLPAFVREHAEALKADIALVCDTGMWDRKTPAVTSSLRGLLYEEIIVTCANRDLHSGLYGGAARNPIHVLAGICAALHDEDGRITVPHFYDGVTEIAPEVLERWKALNLTAEDFLHPIGLKNSAGETGRMLIEQIQSRPTCDVNGIVGGYTGVGAKTVIPGKASAKISFRLVGEQDPDAIRDNFRAFVKERIPADCSVEFLNHGGSKPIHVPTDRPELAKAVAALKAEWGAEPAVIGSGGSIPVAGDFKRTLGLDALLIGFGLDDDRVHSPNEKYDLNSFHKGIRSWVRILDALGNR